MEKETLKILTEELISSNSFIEVIKKNFIEKNKENFSKNLYSNTATKKQKKKFDQLNKTAILLERYLLNNLEDK